MTPQGSADIPLDREVGASAGGSPISVDERVPTAKPVVTARLIYALMAYYIALITGSIAVIALLMWQFGEVILAPPKDDTQIVIRVLASMAFLVSGAIVGSVLYQIRALFRSYIKLANFDPRWLPKYISAPMEAAGLARAVQRSIQLS
jgi:hypothetical protein